MKNEEKFNWCGYEWTCQDHIKNDNENYKDAYFAPEAVYLEDGILHLGIIKKTTRWKDLWTQAEPVRMVLKPSRRLVDLTQLVRHWPSRFGQKGDSRNPWPVRKYGVGEVSSVDKFSYGTFTWQARLPKGTYLWPALWLSGAEHWPPEIDAMEAYSYAEPNFTPKGLFTKIETNIHYEEDGQHRHVGPRGIHNFLYKICHRDDWDEWRVEWMPGHVSIYYNGICIRSCWNRRAMDTLNAYPTMEVIMNMMILKGFDDAAFEKYGKKAELLVRNFHYKTHRP